MLAWPHGGLPCCAIKTAFTLSFPVFLFHSSLSCSSLALFPPLSATSACASCPCFKLPQFNFIVNWVHVQTYCRISPLICKAQTHLCSYGSEVYLLGAQIKLLHGQILLQLVDLVVQLPLQAARLRAIQCINGVLQA